MAKRSRRTTRRMRGGKTISEATTALSAARTALEADPENAYLQQAVTDAQTDLDNADPDPEPKPGAGLDGGRRRRLRR